MKSEWESMSFTFVAYKDTDLSILAAFDDIQVLLDDHIVKTTTMKNSPFIKAFETEINEWDQRLVSEIIIILLLLLIIIIIIIIILIIIIIIINITI